MCSQVWPWLGRGMRASWAAEGQARLGSRLELTHVKAGGLAKTSVEGASCEAEGWGGVRACWYKGGGWAVGSPVSFSKPWSSSRMFSHFRSLCGEGQVGMGLGSGPLHAGWWASWVAPSPVHDTHVVAVGHGAEQLPEQPAGLLLLQPRAAAVVRGCVDVLQQVPTPCQL